MKKLHFTIILLVVAALICGTTSCKKDKKEDPISPETIYTIGVENADYLPFLFSENGTLTGLELDILNAIAKDQNLTYKLARSSFEEIFDNVDNGNVDAAISCIEITDERKEKYDFSLPYYQTGIVLTVKSDNNDILTPSDLSGKIVAVQSGTTMEDFAAQFPTIPFTIISYDTYEEVYESVVNGNADACFGDKPVTEYLISKGSPLKNVELFKPNNLAMIVKKGSNNSFLAKLNKGLANIINDGTLDRIIAKYFISSFQIAVTDNYPPFSFIDENGNAAGIDIEILRAIAADQGFDFDLHIWSIPDIQNGVQSGILHGAATSVTFTEERNKIYDFSVPYFNTGMAFVVKPEHTDLNRLIDFNQKTVAVQEGSTMADFLLNQQQNYHYEYSIIYKNDANDIFNAILDGTADAGFVETPIFDYAFAHGLALRKGTEIYENSYFGFIVSKGENRALMDAFNRGFATIMSNGVYDAIIEKYY